MNKRTLIDGDILSMSVLKTALAWAYRGVPVLAVWNVDDDGNCACGDLRCPNAGKHPIGPIFPHGLRSATTDTKKIREAFQRYPDANLAIVPPDWLVVLDVDGRTGRDTFESLSLPDTASVITARGRHYYFLSRDSAFDELPKLDGIDIRTNGNGYVVVPPSGHASGKQYRWGKRVRELSPITASALRRSQIVRVDLSDTRVRVSEGGRNNALTSFAGYLRYRGLDGSAIATVLAALNKEICTPPLDQAEVNKIARSVGSYLTDYEEAFGTLADVAEEEVQWLGYPYFPRGVTTVIDGDPGQGKSTFVMAIVAAVTTGRKLPFIPDLGAGIVVILSAEDDAARVMKPRLLANGADVSKVRFQKTPFTLDRRGLDLLRAELERSRPAMLVIDPLIAYMDASTDLHNANETMKFMIELDLLAREFDTVIVLIRHLRKSDANEPMYRGIGSIAIAARMRSGLVLGRHPDNPNIRAVAHHKSNYALPGPTILFEIVAKRGRKVPKVQWLGTDPNLTAEDLLRRPQADRGRPDTEREDAKHFLCDMLANGPKLKSSIERAAEARSFSPMTLRRAADELGIIKGRQNRQSLWSLPKGSAKTKLEKA